MLLLASWCRADTATLVTGKKFTGKIALAGGNALSITPKDGPPEQIAARDLIAATFDGAPAKPTMLTTLIDGTQVAGEAVLSMDDHELRLKRPDGGIFSVNPALVSQINFAPAEPRTPPTAQFVGAMLAGKDVAEGDVLTITPNSVKISSVLFGVQELDTKKTVKAVYLRPTGVSKSMYVVGGRDGSVWQATSLTLDAGKASLATDLAGNVSLPANAIASIALGPAAVDDMAALTATPSEPLRLTAGQEQHVAVGGKYRAVSITFGVPTLYMPLRSARLIVLADGKEIAKTDALTSIDRPVTITRSVEGIKELTFKLEATGPEQLGIAGQIAPGQLIRMGS